MLTSLPTKELVPMDGGIKGNAPAEVSHKDVAQVLGRCAGPAASITREACSASGPEEQNSKSLPLRISKVEFEDIFPCHGLHKARSVYPPPAENVATSGVLGSRAGHAVLGFTWSNHFPSDGSIQTETMPIQCAEPAFHRFLSWFSFKWLQCVDHKSLP